MKKLIFIFLLSFISISSFSQDYFTSKFWNRLTADTIKVNQWLIYKGDTIWFPTYSNARDLQIKMVADPTDPQDAANKRYVDGQISVDSTMLIQTFSTSITHGGELSINADNTKFDITAGSGYVIDSYTDGENPTFTRVDWDAKIAVTPTYLNTALITYIAIDVNGDIFQSTTVLTNEQRQDYIIIGVLAHYNLTSIINVGDLQMWNQNTMSMWRGFIYALKGRVNIEGNIFSANGTNLTIDKSVGKIYGIGVNYGTNKKDHCVAESSAATGLVFLRGYRGTPSNITATTLIDPSNYDPEGTGLVSVPANYFTVQFIYFDISTGIVIIQYGQFAYDSMKKAADAACRDAFAPLPELNGVLARGALIVKQGATDLSDPLQAKFVEYGALGRIDKSVIESYSRFPDASNLVNGLSNTKQDITFTESGGTVYFEMEDEDGNDLVYTLGGREYVLDCTAGSGSSGRAQIALLAGSDDNPRTQYIYVTKSGDAAILNISESLPTGEFAWVWSGSLQSVAKFLTDGNKPYVSRRLTEGKVYDGRGAISYERERIRIMGSYTTSSIGGTPNITIIDNAVGDDSVKFELGAGIVYQLNRQNMGVLQSWDEGIRLMNPYVSADTWSYIYDLNDITTDALGNALNNQCFNFVFIGNVNSADGQDLNWIGVLAPSGVYGYTDINSALSDNNNTAVTSVPSQADNTAFLTCRVTFRLKNGVWENLTESEQGINYYDLRGTPLGAATGGVGTPVSQTFDDNTFQVQNASDATKIWKVDVSGVTTATTRTLTIPDVNDTIAVRGDLHDAVTIGTANGLSLSTQQLSLALASTSTTGALSNTDWNIFNGKEEALIFSTGLTRSVNTITTNDSEIDHDGLLNYVIGQHRIINDAGTSATELWSASKMNTTFGNYVPYTGATANVDLGLFDLYADSLSITNGATIGGDLHVTGSGTFSDGITLLGADKKLIFGSGANSYDITRNDGDGFLEFEGFQTSFSKFKFITTIGTVFTISNSGDVTATGTATAGQGNLDAHVALRGDLLGGTEPIDGSTINGDNLTTGYVSKKGSTTLENSIIQDDGATIGIGKTPTSEKLDVFGNIVSSDTVKSVNAKFTAGAGVDYFATSKDVNGNLEWSSQSSASDKLIDDAGTSVSDILSAFKIYESISDSISGTGGGAIAYFDKLTLNDDTVTVTFPASMSTADYPMPLFRGYDTISIDGDLLQIVSGVQNLTKTISGFTAGFKDTVEFFEYYVVDSIAPTSIEVIIPPDTLFTTVNLSDETTDLSTGVGIVTIPMPINSTLIDVFISVNTAPTGSTIIVDINEAGVSVLSTKLSIDIGEKNSSTAAVPPIISDSDLAQYSEISFDIDQKGSTVAGNGLKAIIYYIKN